MGSFAEPYLAAFGIRRPRVHVPFWVAWTLGGAIERIYSVIGGWLPSDPVMTRYTAAAVCRDFWFVHEGARRDLSYAPIVSADVAFERTLAWLRATHA